MAPSALTPGRAPGDRFDARTLSLLTVMVVGPILALLDASIVNVGIDRLSRELDAQLATMQWATTAYLLALVVAMPTAAWLTDRFGGRTVFVGALMLFVAGSALCALAWSAESLIAFRALQGLGGGALEPTMFTVLARAVGRERAGRMVGLVGVPLMLGPALGPLVGGVILERLAWQWMFLVNVPLGLALIVCALRVVPDDRGSEGAPAPIDAFGIALLTGAAAALVLGFSQAAEHGFGTAAVVSSLGGALALAFAYLRWARRRGSRAVVDLGLFRHGGFLALTGANLLHGTVLYPLLFLVPLFFQQAHGTGPLEAGALLVPEALGAAAGFNLGGRLVAAHGVRRLVAIGLSVYAVALVPFALADATTAHVPLSIALAVAGLGFGVSGGSVLGAVYGTVPPRSAARASAVTFMSSQIGGAVGIAVATVLLGDDANAAPRHGTAFAAVGVVAALGVLSAPLLPGRRRRER
ncbi:DHA2 family efflux MFS transporter permease subunit [Conexibacter arvalis]|uniref:EmrB/QacA subfamily drug resistance transporter n=1 Tax=Conexibacter arvalis TaxID=912552 RepID=A0A840IA66_9ACTN|nr:DHA2 family efflux MFS transporter permease subunit [Conexibacter arvalis]MBB4661799.1 EmrB/QacA subfamily drug resistance transporter [Conexibacter arvalis]